jgi:zinc/manganese transport system substrate-binding protein
MLAASALALAACGAPAPDGATTPAATPANSAAGTPEGPTVAIATTTQLGSVLGEITACAGATSTTLMGPGDDPHTFAASSAQVAEMTRAGLVVTSGLGLEEGLETAIAGAEQDGATVLEIAPLVDPIEFGEEPLEEGESHDDHEHGDEDPHFWFDVARMAAAAELMGDALATETGNETFRDCGAAVREDLLEVDAEVREILAAVPEDRRVLVTDHQSFGYFAEAYGFEIAGVVIPGGSTDAEPSSVELAALVDVIRETGTPALFSNTAVMSSLVDAVAAEVGGGVTVVPLYVGSVGPEGSGAETYAGMMVTNATLIAEALS